MSQLNPQVRVPTSECPYCGAKLSAAAGLGESVVPKAGDATICLECAEPLIFTATMNVRKPDEREAAELAAHEDTQELIQVVQATRYARDPSDEDLFELGRAIITVASKSGGVVFLTEVHKLLPDWPVAKIRGLLPAVCSILADRA